MPKDKIKLAETLLGKPKPLNITEWQIQRLRLVHPWASRETVIRMISDHQTRRTTTKEGKRGYMKFFMRLKRQEERRRQGK